MNAFEEAQQDLTLLLKLARASATYCAQVALKPSLATAESHEAEIAREVKIVELERKYGLAGR